MQDELTIKRSRRKTMAIHVGRDGEVEVRAPHHVSDSLLDRFVRQNTDWIAKRKKVMLASRPIEKTCEEGERHLYLGDWYELSYRDVQSRSVELEDHLRVKASTPESARRILERWYKLRAKHVINERTEDYSQNMQLKHAGIRIGSAKHVWGSCAPDNRLNFTWRLVMTPVETIDYVIVHELAHIKHKNHGKRFWNLVESILPDYRERKQWLEDNHKHLFL